MTNDDKLGQVKFADEVVAICAMNAAVKTPGVIDLSAGLSETISKNILGKTSLYRGIKISQENLEVTVDINLIIRYGIKIPEVAWNVQENVKNEIETMTELKVKAVNIFIQGVSRSKIEV
jgi:uncharacterized alkaline shock family protein YloU